jgi:epoxyqueuosine reductase
MTNLKEQLKKLARDLGGDLGVANIERFDNAPSRMHPKNIFPECKSVISILAPFPRGAYRGITEGTHWANYTYYSYNKLNTIFRPMITYEVACLLEDHGAEAVPIYPGVPERSGMHPAVAPDRPAPDISLNVRIAGVACGLGEIGWAKVFIHPKWGPRVRLGTILTDIEIEPDPIIKPGTLCKRCMKCVDMCPGGAIPRPGEREPVKIKIDDIEIEWGDVLMGRCTMTHHGLNYEASPFLKKSLPGLDIDVRNSNISEEVAYRATYTMSGGNWHPNEELSNNTVIPFYKQIRDHTGYFAVCGAKGCVRTCMAFQEQTKNIEQSNFKTKVFERDDWVLPPPSEDVTGGVAEGKFPEEYNYPDKNAGKFGTPIKQ